MTTPSQTMTPAGAAVGIQCPPWCAGSTPEHEFERGHGYPVQHFSHFHPDPAGPTPAVSLTRSVHPDGSIETQIEVEDDDYDVDMAERTALAMLEAVKAARA